MTAAVEVEAAGRRLRLSNLEKLLWPEAGFTKGALLDYYRAVAPWLLPHLAGRAVTLRRFPDGVDGLGWYQNECRGRPQWLRTHPLPHRRGHLQNFCAVDDLPSLLWVANLATIELHPFLALAERPDEPTALVFDLDPGPPAGILECCAVAGRIRELLGAAGLEAWPKTSGGGGLHLYVPLARGHSFAETKAFARTVAESLARARPDEVVAVQRRAARRGKVLVDWLQNDATRSTVAPYSLRAVPWPTASVPVTWGEVDDALETRRPELLTFLAPHALERLEEHRDVFAPVLGGEQVLA